MTIRNKLLIVLLSISLVPLAVYFVLDISFSRVVRSRIEKTLRLAVERRARETLVQTVEDYEEKLRISSQAVRYGLRHYADQVQQAIWSINVGQARRPSPRNLMRASSEDISKEAQKYQFINAPGDRKPAVDFDSQFVFPVRNGSESPLLSQLSKLTRTCKSIYSINPESKLWIYTVLKDGTVENMERPALRL